MKKTLIAMLSMMLLLSGCGAKQEPVQNNEPKQEAVQQEEKAVEEVVPEVEEEVEVEEEEVFAYQEYKTVDELASAIVQKLAGKGVTVTEANREDDGYATVITYYVAFEHDIDSDGFDWSSDSDFTLVMVVDNTTLDLYTMTADSIMTPNNQSETMKGIAEVFTELYGNEGALAELNATWNPRTDLSIELQTNDDFSNVMLYTYTDAQYGVVTIDISAY